MKRKVGQCQMSQPKRPRTEDAELADIMEQSLKRGLEGAGDAPARKRVRFAPPAASPRSRHEAKWGRVMGQLLFFTRDRRMLERVCEVTREIARRNNALTKAKAALEERLGQMELFKADALRTIATLGEIRDHFIAYVAEREEQAWSDAGTGEIAVY